jgi:uncharacterized repeat protein (TIGR03803 family)
MNHRGLRPFLYLSLFSLMCLAAASAQTYNVLLNFDGTNGNSPDWLVQGLDGDLYGTTMLGGSQRDGTIFRVTTSGQLTTLYNFAGSGAGSQPYFGLVLDSNGNFYSVMGDGGTKLRGSVFQITAAGKFSLAEDELHRWRQPAGWSRGWNRLQFLRCDLHRRNALQY